MDSIWPSKSGRSGAQPQTASALFVLCLRDDERACLHKFCASRSRKLSGLFVVCVLLVAESMRVKVNPYLAVM